MFCLVWKVVGHSLDSCRRANKELLNISPGTKKKPSQNYVQIHKENAKFVQGLVIEPKIIVDNSLMEVRSGKRPLVEQNQHSKTNQQEIYQDGTSGVEKSPPLNNKFTTLLDVIEE